MIVTPFKNLNDMFSAKEGVELGDLKKITPPLGVVFYTFVMYAKEQSLPCVVTSILGDAEGRKSSTHQEGRGMDIRSVGWDKRHIENVCLLLNNKYASFWGTSPDGISPMVILHHQAKYLVDGGPKLGAPHFHLQVQRNALLRDFL